MRPHSTRKLRLLGGVVLGAVVLGAAASAQEAADGRCDLREALRRTAEALRPACAPPERVAVAPPDSSQVMGTYAARMLAFLLKPDVAAELVGADCGAAGSPGGDLAEASLLPSGPTGRRLAAGAESVEARWLAGLRRARATVVLVPVPTAAAGGGVLRTLAYATETGKRLADVSFAWYLPPDLAFLPGAERRSLPERDQAWEALLCRLLPPPADDPETARAACEAACLYELGQWPQAAERLARPEAAPPTTDTVRQVMALTAGGRREEAAAVVEAGLKRRPDSGPLYALKAWLALRSGQPENALVLLEQARLSDMGREGYYCLASYLAADALVDRPDAARAALLRAMDLEGRDPLVLLHGARHFWSRAEAERAADLYARALEAGAAGASPLLEYSAALEALGDSQKAQDALRRAFELEPGKLHVVRSLASSLQASGRYDEALAVLARAIRLRPDRVELLVAYGDAAASMWRIREAEQAFSEASRLDGAATGAAARLAGALRVQRRWDEARAVLDQLLADNPDCPPARLELARLLADQGDQQAALAALQQVARASDYEVSARLEMVRVLCREGRADEAVQNAQMAVTTRPDAESLAALARAFIALGDLAKAQDAVAKALEVSGRSPTGRLAAAELAAAQGRPDQALEQAEQAVAMDACCLPARVMVARLWAGRNMPAHAAAKYEDALKLDPWDPDLHWELAEILRAGDAARAIEHYRRHIALRGAHSQAAAARLTELHSEAP